MDNVTKIGLLCAGTTGGSVIEVLQKSRFHHCRTGGFYFEPEKPVTSFCKNIVDVRL